MNKFQKVLNQVTKDTLSKDPIKEIIEIFGRERVFRTMRICHRIEIKDNKVDFNTLSKFKVFNKKFKY